MDTHAHPWLPFWLERPAQGGGHWIARTRDGAIFDHSNEQEPAVALAKAELAFAREFGPWLVHRLADAIVARRDDEARALAPLARPLLERLRAPIADPLALLAAWPDWTIEPQGATGAVLRHGPSGESYPVQVDAAQDVVVDAVTPAHDARADDAPADDAPANDAPANDAPANDASADDASADDARAAQARAVFLLAMLARGPEPSLA